MPSAYCIVFSTSFHFRSRKETFSHCRPGIRWKPKAYAWQASLGEEIFENGLMLTAHGRAGPDYRAPELVRVFITPLGFVAVLQTAMTYSNASLGLRLASP